MSGNQALNVNYGQGGYPTLDITTNGSDWYWTVCAIMLTSTLVFIGWSFTKPSTHRLFHYLTAVITFVAGIAYFCMASDLGKTPIVTEFGDIDRHEPLGTRAIYYVRYIDWAITTPLLLTDLLLTAGMPASEMVVTILMDEVSHLILPWPPLPEAALTTLSADHGRHRPRRRADLLNLQVGLLDLRHLCLPLRGLQPRLHRPPLRLRPWPEPEPHLLHVRCAHAWHLDALSPGLGPQ